MLRELRCARQGACGWVSVNRSAPICWSTVTALPSMTRQAAGVVDVDGIEPKQMSAGLVDVHHALREDDAVGRSHRVA
jgi:hypothetical protein